MNLFDNQFFETIGIYTFITISPFIISTIFSVFDDNTNKNAHAVIKSYSDKYRNIKGNIYFTEMPNGNTLIKGYITGLPSGKHGFHIHESGDMSEGCSSMKGHYNPFGKEHGSRVIYKDGKYEINYDRHVGDLGNIVANRDGIASFEFEDPLIKLTGYTSIIDRGIIIHEGEDDLGLGGNEESKKTGNAGARIACGVITNL